MVLNIMVEDYQIPWWHRWYKYKYNFVDFQPSICAGVQIWGIRLWSNSIRMTQVESAEACQQLCQAREGCFFFTWVGPTTPVEFYRSTQGCVFQDLENNWTFHKKDINLQGNVLAEGNARKPKSRSLLRIGTSLLCLGFLLWTGHVWNINQVHKISYAVWNMNLVSCGSE